MADFESEEVAQHGPGEPSSGTYGVSAGRKRLNDLLNVPTVSRQGRAPKAKVQPKAKQTGRRNANAGVGENQLAALAQYGLDQVSSDKILEDLECEGLDTESLPDWRLITLVEALDVDDFGDRADWLDPYKDMLKTAADPDPQIPTRWTRKEIILRMAAKSLGF